MLRSRIVGTGRYLPEKVLTNKDLEQFMDTTDEWIRQRTGIGQRHVAAEGTGSSDMGAIAAQRALASADVDPMDIDLVICCTMTSDYLFPSSACLIQHKIGAKRAAAFDLNAACSGFVYSVSIADALIRSGANKTVLVVGADLMTNRISWEKRDTAVLFGDGAGAVVMRGEEGDHGVLTSYICADGGPHDLLYLPCGGSLNVIRLDNIDEIDLGIVMKGRELFKYAVKAFGEAAERAMTDSGMTVEDIDLFVPHQANTRIIYSVAERLGLPKEKVYMNIEHVANTVAATIPIALDEAVEQGRIKTGDKVLLVAFGAGLTWGSAMLRW
jgi:3-oxoacyl-[acyl-carrier-protein] synthase III